MKKRCFFVFAVLMMALLACRLDFSPADENAIATAAAQTVAAMQTDEPAVVPTITPQPTYTPTLKPTATPLPCNKAEFISETVPDNTVFDPNEEFTKSWRLKNIGTCTWNTNYRVKIQSGDDMDLASGWYFPQYVQPGEKMDVVLDLKAPSSPGKYTSFWQLQDDHGTKFGQVYLVIEVE